MRHGYWSTFVAFLAALTVLGFGMACLVWAEKTDSFSWKTTRIGWETTRKARRLRILGWIVIAAGIPLLIVFIEELLVALRFAY